MYKKFQLLAHFKLTKTIRKFYLLQISKLSIYNFLSFQNMTKNFYLFKIYSLASFR